MKDSLISIITIISVLALVEYGCKEEPTAPKHPVQTMSLSVSDSTCTDVWLRLTYSDCTNYAIKLYRDTTLIFEGIIYSADTLFLDYFIQSPVSQSLNVPLSPNTPYAYRAYRIENNLIVDSSNLVQTRTIDTTSHDFQWTTYELGEGTSYLRDVCVINDTCVWAVGRIYLRDSTGNLEWQAHNAARWDGNRWEVVKLWFPLWTSNGNAPGPHEGMAVFGFSPNDVWFSDGGSYLHWNGTAFEPHYFPPESELRGGVKMWGTSSQNLFSVYYNGWICHFDGTVWRRMESGTDVDLRDIHGTPDGKEVWVCGYNSSYNRSVVLRLRDRQWQLLWETNNPNALYGYSFRMGLWLSQTIAFSIGSSVQRHSLLNLSSLRRETFLGMGFPRAGIQGSRSNNLWIGGDGGAVSHFNGVTWKTYSELTNGNVLLFGLDVNDKSAWLVGGRFSAPLSKGLVYYGKRK